MYMTFRQMHADMSRAPEALAVATAARDHLNSEYGTDFAVSINVGGDPSAISMTCAWEKLGAYEKLRADIATDAKMQSYLRMGGSMLTGIEDTIGQILKAPGARGAYASVSTASMSLPAVGDAIQFALEVAEFAEKKTGRAVGVMVARTGNRSGLMWASFADSMDQIMDDNQELEADSEWLNFFKRSEGLFHDGSLEDSIWQMMP